jgi:NTE family protein
MVLAGGGARGFAHVGALRALEADGLRPSALVGVSMGAVVSATYAARADWYEALLAMDTSAFPQPVHGDGGGEGPPLLTRAVGYVHTAWNMITSWGAPSSAVDAGWDVLDALVGSTTLEAGRIPVAVCATDLVTGRRVTMRTGSAADAVYASAALAGVLPPLPVGDQLLADGAYADLAPIDVARDFGYPVVMVIDPSQPAYGARIHNGLEAVMRAMEICHLRHAELRMRDADLVIRPDFGRAIDVLDFDARRECIAAGERAFARQRQAIHRLLGRTR